MIDRLGEWSILVHPTKPRYLVTTAAGERIALGILNDEPLSALQHSMLQEFEGFSSDQLLQDHAFVREELLRTGFLGSPADTPQPAKRKSTDLLTIYITEQCNLRCKHCAVVEGVMPKDRITTADVLRLMEEYSRIMPEGTIAILGGEPFMHPDIITLLEAACRSIKTVRISTNGSYITPSVAEKLGPLTNLQLQVSLDGADEQMHDFIRGKNSFKATWKAIELLVPVLGDRLSISTTLTKVAVPQVQEFLSLCDAKRIPLLRFINLNRTHAARSNWDKIAPDPDQWKAVLRWLIFEASSRPGAYTRVAASFPGFVPNRKETEDHWCPLGAMLIVTASGKTYNCPILEDPITEVGDALAHSAEELVNHPANTRTREWMHQRQNVVEECSRCAWRSFCGGGCTSFMGLRSGDLLQNDGFCGFRRNLYREHAFRALGLPLPEMPEV
ncbi:MAG: radical SAM protein [Candidatus Sumerlaeia bacterium]|nr:radical SAM protein [Candidatus Sumerlaeia bacterium]